jgi:eukaryotic-like serine/threonine-protein kinase
MTDLIGQTIDHYRIDRLLGTGGMGIIYAATDLKLDRPVAMKVMHDHLASHEQFRERFLQEARAAATLEHHPNIVRVLDFSPGPTRLYIVMELITGGSVRDYLNRLGPGQQYLEHEEAIMLVRQTAEALDYAHQHGMIHRDVKPENILLKPAGGRPNRVPFQAMLTDFGLAKLSESIGMTMTGRPLGTFPYMSPEQFQGSEVDGRTDIYALGIVLYELTVGRLPYKPQNMMEAYRMHSLEPIPAPGNFRPNFPRSLERVIVKCMGKRREDRYQTAKELASVLERLGMESEHAFATAAQPPPPTNGQKTDVAGAEQISFVYSQLLQDVPVEHDSVVILSKGQPARIIPISKKEMLIGRDPAKDIVLPDKAVSRDHAVLERKADGTYWIRDLGSTNSSKLGDTKLSKDVPEEWMYGQTLRIANFALRLQSGAAGQMSNMSDAASAPAGDDLPSYRLTGLDIQEAHQPITVAMVPANVKVKPGETAEVRVEIANQTNRPDHVTLEIRGVPGGWAEISQQIANVLPGTSSTVPITFTPPRQWTSRAGKHIYTLRVHSTNQQIEIAKLTGVLHIETFQNFSVNLHPKRLHDTGTATLTIANNGNAGGDFLIQARDRENGLSFYFERQQIDVQPGQSEEITFEVNPRSSALVHGAKMLPFEVTVKAADGTVQTTNGELLAVSNMAQPVNAYASPIYPAALPEGDSISLQPAYEYYERENVHERGGCLTLWLLAYSGWGLLLIPVNTIATFSLGFLVSFGTISEPLPYVILLISSWIFTLVYGLAVIQTWNWRKWAIYVLMFLSFFMIPLGPVLTILWWQLVKDKRDMFR